MTVRSIATAAGAITVREGGAGTPLLLLHGIGSGAGSWVHQLAAFAPRFHVIAWDAPGYGNSDPLAMEAPGAQDYARSLLSLADALGLARFHLVGHSLGAIMAAAFAAEWPARVRTLTLADAAAGYGTASPAVRQAKAEDRIAAFDCHGAAGLAERRAHALLSPGAGPEALAIVRENMRHVNREGYAQAARMLGAADIFAHVRGVRAPTLVLCGTADTVTPEANVRHVAAAIPGARYMSLPGLGHASYVEGPAAFNGALQDFLAAHPA